MELVKGKYKFQVEITVSETVGHAVVWLAISVITLGLGLFAYPYYVIKLVLERTKIIDLQTGKTIGTLKVNVSPYENVGHIIIWWLLTYITIGLALFIYAYQVFKLILNKTEIVPIN
jgi:uncharacterized membrane protein YjgN (DUF898 family)